MACGSHTGKGPSLATQRGTLRGGAEAGRGSVMSQTLEAVLEVEQAVLCVGGVGRGRRVAELGVRLVALRLAPGQLDLGGVADDDVIAGAHVEGPQAVDEKL